MDGLKSRTLLQKDRRTLMDIFDSIQSEFESAWKERKTALTKHARFCIFAAELKTTDQEIHQLQVCSESMRLPKLHCH